MRKLPKILLAMAMCGVVGCSNNSDTIKATQNVHYSSYDWGVGTSKIVLNLDNEVDKVTKDTFKVKETKQATDFTKADFPVSKVSNERKITDAYLSDENGKKVSSASKNVTLELYCSPDEGSPLLFSMNTQLNTYSKPYQLEVTLNNNQKITSNNNEVKTFTVSKEIKNKTTDADNFKTSTFKSKDKVEYKYAYQNNKSDTLVVWLHGLGEGGVKDTDPNITLLANKVTSLAGKEFQSKVKSSILVPQCPTYWMDNDGKSGNFKNGAINADGTSYYSNSLDELIEKYKKECGAKKVVLAGCSNGGYMTMVMAIKNPTKYAAIVPICEALPDKYITDENINAIKDIPMFFIYSKADTTVVPSEHEEPTIKRLQAASAKNLEVSTSEKVIDTSGQYKDENGDPYTYNGHWSWIYFFNNESVSDTTNIKVWDWLSNQVK